jgi:hypothetical protein
VFKAGQLVHPIIGDVVSLGGAIKECPTIEATRSYRMNQEMSYESGCVVNLSEALGLKVSSGYLKGSVGRVNRGIKDMPSYC